MTYKQITSTAPVIDFIVKTLKKHLNEGKRVLWLVPGGSSIAIAVAVSKQLEGTDLTNLSMSLTDERYGAVGHADSNWQQLAEAGFALPGALTVPVLTDEDQPTTAAEFSANLKELISDADVKIGFFGIGPDGHTAGILPGSPAVTSTEYAASYDAGNFIRVTMTPKAIELLDEAVVYAVGEPKWPVLEELRTDIALQAQPAQVLKEVAMLTIFNDHIGDI